MSKTVTFRANDNAVAQLEEMTQRTGMTKTKLLHDAIARYHAAADEVPVPANVVSVILPTSCTHSFVSNGRCLGCGKVA